MFNVVIHRDVSALWNNKLARVHRRLLKPTPQRVGVDLDMSIVHHYQLLIGPSFHCNADANVPILQVMVGGCIWLSFSPGTNPCSHDF